MQEAGFHLERMNYFQLSLAFTAHVHYSREFVLLSCTELVGDLMGVEPLGILENSKPHLPGCPFLHRLGLGVIL